MRQSAGFNVVDRIAIDYSASDELASALSKHNEWIRNETLAHELQWIDSPNGELVEQFKIGLERATVGVKRVG